MANYTPNYTVTAGTIPFNNKKIPFIIIDLDINNTLNVGDELHFGNTFASDIYDSISDKLVTVGVFENRATPLNQWGFENATYYHSTNNNISLESDVNNNPTTFFYCRVRTRVKVNTTYFNLSMGGYYSGGYGMKYNISPLILFRNKETKKFLYFSSYSSSPLYKSDVDTGIAKLLNVPVSLVVGEPQNFSDSKITFYGYLEIEGVEPLEPVDTDPYVDGGGSSGGGGGEGNFDDTSDTIPIPSLPSISGLNTGFFTAFVCTQSQLQNVSNYLWTDVISDILDTSTGLGEKVDALKKMVTSPYDAIMGCSLVPVSPPTGGSKEVKMYGVIKTGISLPYASSRWVEVDCGTLNIHEFWGSYLDYSPYTKTTSLYLPYIGVVSVDIDLIMAKALQVVYHVDILSGICIAYIVVDGSVKFQYQGHCSTTIPVTSSDYSGAIQSGLGLVGNIANVVSSGVSGGLSGGLGGAVLGATGSAISQAPSVASNVMGMKPDIKSGGGVGSSGGILGVQKPFLIIERPKQSVPAFQNGFSGYPCNMTKKLGDLSGYTEVERIVLEDIPLTEDERNELIQILESGVYL